MTVNLFTRSVSCPVAVAKPARVLQLGVVCLHPWRRPLKYQLKVNGGSSVAISYPSVSGSGCIFHPSVRRQVPFSTNSMIERTYFQLVHGSAPHWVTVSSMRCNSPSNVTGPAVLPHAFPKRYFTEKLLSLWFLTRTSPSENQWCSRSWKSLPSEQIANCWAFPFQLWAPTFSCKVTLKWSWH